MILNICDKSNLYRQFIWWPKSSLGCKSWAVTYGPLKKKLLSCTISLKETMIDDYEIIPSENKLIKMVVSKTYNLEIAVYYAGKLPAEIPDKFVFIFGHLNKETTKSDKDVNIVFAIPSYEQIKDDEYPRHMLIIGGMHHYLQNEWYLGTFDNITCSPGYVKHILDGTPLELSKLHADLLAHFKG